jgi:hypothetical protein
MLINANRLLNYVNRFIMNHLQYITDAIIKFPDHRVVFDDAIKVKASPHITLFVCAGACVGPDGVYLMDYAGEWHGPLKEDQVNAGLMISSLYQRLKVMSVPSVVVGSYDCEVNAIIFE